MGKDQEKEHKTDFEIAVGIQKKIAGLEIAVQDISRMKCF